MQTTLREERFRKLMESFQHDLGHRAARTSTTHRIQKVAFLLRENENYRAYYEPRVVSLGPIHHGKEKYQQFVKSSGNTIEELCNEIEKNIKELGECFEEEVTKKYNDVDLAWILFVDGCAILQYIDLVFNDKFKDLNIKNNSVVFCHQDLFLLKNQVPYDLLELLMNLSNMGDEFRNSVQNFIKCCNMAVQMGKSSDQNGKRKPTHLLDLLSVTSSSTVATATTTIVLVLVLAIRLLRCSSTTITSLMSCCNINRSNSCFKGGLMLLKSQLKVEKMTEHLFSGHFINASRDRCYNSIIGGVETTKEISCKFLVQKRLANAYEMCPDFENDYGIASYKAHVLYNWLENDEKAAQLFNELIATCNDLQVPIAGVYLLVEQQIGEYFDNKIMVWMAELFHDIFSRPWKIVAFFGSLSALVLTATQTWYSPSGPCANFCKKLIT
ncbi:hypothetical protein I3843_10G037600 [Carya illinoinensis]|nr:hypothetical protein I3843_10G037600 [Carya illinoinensis]